MVVEAASRQEAERTDYEPAQGLPPFAPSNFLYAGHFTSLVLYRFHASSCSHCMFMIPTIPMYPEDTVSQLPWKPGSHTLSMPISIMCPAACGKEV